MKKLNIIILSVVVLLALSLTSCLKDLEDFMGAFSGTPAIAELSETPNAATGTVAREIINPLVPAVFSLRVNIASSSPLGSPTKVTLALDNSLITAYNTEKGLTGSAAAVPIPLAALSVDSWDITVPAGEMEVDWEFTIDAQLVPNAVTTFYILPVVIDTVNNGVTVSGNFGTKLVRILARNEFDGKYLMKGFIMRPGDTGGLEGFFKNHAKNLTTVAGKSVLMSPNQLWANGGGVGGIGPWTITVNDAGSPPFPITVADGVASGWLMDPAYANKYDPVTRTFFFKVNWGTAVPKNRGCTDTLVYVGPRP